MQGFNRYYPPDYDPKDAAYKGNLNRLAGKAAQKPVVRFAMPFNMWCGHCERHIARGVRFNATKLQAGKYLSSPIFHFSFKCHLCATGRIVIATNPECGRYDVVSGGRQKVEDWSAEGEAGTAATPAARSGADSVEGDDEGAQDAIEHLEREATRRQGRRAQESHVAALLGANARWSDAFAASQTLRRTFRAEKARLRTAARAREAVGDAFALGVDVLDRTDDDRTRARAVDFDGPAWARQAAERREAQSGPLFAHGDGERFPPPTGIVEAIRHSQRSRLDPFGTEAPAKRQKEIVSGIVPVKRATSDDAKGLIHGALVNYASEDEDGQQVGT